MTNKTPIEWTEQTWNPTVGCDRISPGCGHCYAKTLHDKRHVAVLAGKKLAPQYRQPFEVLQLLEERLDAPLRRRTPTTYFVNSVSDLFHEDVPDTYIDRVFAVMGLASQHTFQVLTKRADRMRRYFGEVFEDELAIRWADAAGLMLDGDWIWNEGKRFRPAIEAFIAAGHGLTVDGDLTANDDDFPMPLPNVWLGVSVENQHFADERIPLLLQTPAAVRFISAEPLLGLLKIQDEHLTGFYGDECSAGDPSCVGNDGDCHDACEPGQRLDWVIVGGESGAGARPFDLLWARSIVAQCRAAGVPVFVKQLGADPIRLDGDHVRFVSRKGGDPAEWPEDLRVREMPQVAK